MEYRSLLGEIPDGLQASFEAHTLLFKQPSGTSRGILTEKKLWLIRIWSAVDNTIIGTGECSIIPGLSPDFTTVEQYEKELHTIVENPAHFLRNPQLLSNKPSFIFGLETAFIDWKNGGKGEFFDTAFSRGEQSIPINGLVWMGSERFMHDQIEQKLKQGFSCIKMKVGAIDFETEIALLESIRKRYNSDQITLRVDANGAFSLKEVDEKLQRLADLNIHSIEQPIAVGQHTALRDLCQRTPLPIALDEELIPVYESVKRAELLQFVKPQYIILKPSLHGGFSGCFEWIELAAKNNIPWWMTSALESNIGLNAIAQFAATFDPVIPQGLGTGGLYETNFETRLVIENGALFRR